ncbi:MAG: cytochrome c-type biogenesis protein CcmH [Proteobacteria bacterium]|nr:MAG: cytochrome c-type biogenesis protein CcmH [Pseudomonadota bacterium]
MGDEQMKFLKTMSLLFVLMQGQAFAQAPLGDAAMPSQDAVDQGAPAQELPGDKRRKYDTNDPHFRDVAKEFRCPTCTGLSVLESDAGFSVQIKEQVQEQINLGKNHDQIVEYFVERYGAWILREPPAKGINAIAWIVPITLLCLGPILIWLLVWKRRVKADSHGVRSSTVILAEMQESLQRLKRENG